VCRAVPRRYARGRCDGHHDDHVGHNVDVDHHHGGGDDLNHFSDHDRADRVDGASRELVHHVNRGEHHVDHLDVGRRFDRRRSRAGQGLWRRERPVLPERRGDLARRHQRLRDRRVSGTLPYGVLDILHRDPATGTSARWPA